MAKRKPPQARPKTKPVEAQTQPVEVPAVAVQAPDAATPEVKRAVPIMPKMAPPPPKPRERKIQPPEHLRDFVSPTGWLTQQDADRQMLQRLGIDPSDYPEHWFGIIKALP